MCGGAGVWGLGTPGKHRGGKAPWLRTLLPAGPVRSEDRIRPAGTTTFLINLISPGLLESDTQRHDSIALFDLATAVLYTLHVRNCMYCRRILRFSVSSSLISFCVPFKLKAINNYLPP